jgi:hypothetical protein
VLETVTTEEEKNWRRVGYVQSTAARAWRTRLSGGAPDSVRCPRLVNGEPTAFENRRRCTAIIHQTVRWHTGLPGESSATNSLLLGNEKGDVAINHQTVWWWTELSGEPTAPVANGRPRDQRATRGSLHRSAGCTGQCPVRQPAPRSNGQLRLIWKEIAHRT